MMNLRTVYGVYLIGKFHFERKRGLNLTEMFVEKVANVMVVEICGRRRMGGTIDCCVSFRTINENEIV